MNELTKMGLELAHRPLFTVPEWLELEKHVSNIHDFDRTRPIAAASLAAIRDKNLYRAYGSLKEFCVRTFGWSERRTQQMIASVKVIATLPEGKRKIVRTESQARELAKVPTEKRVEVLESIQRHGDITADKIRKERLKDITQTDGQVVDNAGYPITPNALTFWNRRAEVQEILTAISRARTRIGEIKDGDPLYRRVNNLRGKHDKLDEYYNEIKGALPAYVCYSCDGVTVQTCKMCGGTGVVSEFEWGRKADPEGHERRLRALSDHEKNIPF